MSVSNRIEDLVYRLVRISSETATKDEAVMAQELLTVLREMEYFKLHQHHCGLYAIKNDVLNRSVVWGLVKGCSDRTVVLINHLDTVDILDFGELQGVALSPKDLADSLLNVELRPEVIQDLTSGNWLFGRGIADMKGGAAIQLALLDKFGQDNNITGNILYLSVPDEETLSAGMRAAIELLSELQNTYKLQYKLLIDVETHVRNEPSTPVLYTGSIGKIMPAVLVRGVRAHIGNVFQGFSPVALLAEIASSIELNDQFSDVYEGEKAPPPTWMYFRDGKKGYDVSIPETAFGYTSILTFESSPQRILHQIKNIAVTAFDQCLTRYRDAYKKYYGQLPDNDWSAEVYTFSELYQHAITSGKEQFSQAWVKKCAEVRDDVCLNKYDMTVATANLMDFVINSLPHKRPMIVVGFAPPYYPHVVNARLDSCDEKIKNIVNALNKDWVEKNQVPIAQQYFYTAISDMSYASLQDADEVIPHLVPNMPLWGNLYSIPLQHIADLQIPSINLGPWGKDLHMFTERVYKPDLFEHTPKLMEQAILLALEEVK